MASQQQLKIETALSVDQFNSICPMGGDKFVGGQSLLNYMGALLGGNEMANLTLSVGVLPASATFTVSAGGSANGEAGTLLGETLSAVTAGADPDAGEFNISATAATQAASMVLAINAILGDKVLASNELGVVTILSLVSGEVTNGLDINAGDLANVVAAPFAGGSDGTQTVLNFT